MSNTMKYRPEIDGLRTIAILPVIIYHLKISFGSGYLLPGGFLGVDVFFVISGYLITSILLGEVAAKGRVDFRGFYERRARRILPALFLVILASAAAAPFFLLPSELSRFAWSLIAALGFVSNGFWYAELGQYGAQSGLLQPMLHTWSLAIEEQFYLAFPLALLVFTPKGKRTIAVFAGLLILSLVVSEWTSANYKELSFFSPASRAWELLAGSTLAAVSLYGPALNTPRWLPAAGLAAILASMWLIDLPAWNHPGIVTIPVVLGTAAIIWAAHPGEWVTRMLSAGPMVAIGKLSYSLYLWHFPIFAFGRLASPDKPDVLDWAIWVALTVVCSVLGYRLVEKPFRFKVSGRKAMAACAAMLALTAGYVFAATQTRLLDRSGDLVALYGEDEFDNEVLQDRSLEVLRSLSPGEEFTRQNVRHASRHAREDLWFTTAARHKVLIVGDSHSKDLFNALYLNRDRMPGVELALFPIDKLSEATTLAMDAPNFKAADTIVIGKRWGKDDGAVLPGVIEAWQSQGKRVVVVGPTAEFSSPGQLPVYDWYLQRNGRPVDPAEFDKAGYVYEDQRLSRTRAELRDIARQSGANYLERRDLMCNDSARRCTLITSDGFKAMYDYGHWTLAGARLFGERMIDAGWDRILTAEAQGTMTAE